MAWLDVVGAEVGVSPAATFFIRKTAPGTTRTVQIHGNMGLGGRGRGARSWSRGGWRPVGEAGLGLLLAAGEVGRNLVLFDVDGGGDAVLEQGRDRPPGSEFKPDGLPNFA